MGVSYLCGIIILCSTAYLASAQSVIIPVKPIVHQVIEGNDLHVTCSAEQTEGVEIYWVKNETNSEFFQNGTVLEFSKIHRSATGDYVCYRLNLTAGGNATSEKVISVDVLYPAEITGFNINSTVVVEPNWFKVFCNFTGNPIPDFIIMNNQTKHVYLEAKASVAVTVEAQAIGREAGTWICTGRNYLNQGKNVTRSGNVTVLCGPSPTDLMTSNDYSIYAMLGQSTFLFMQNYGNPSPNYTWSHNGKILPADRHLDLGYASKLEISNVQIEDYGTYYLDMKNAYGSFRSRYELKPLGPPERPSNLQYSEVTHNSAKLGWTSGFNMGSTQYFVILRLTEDGLEYEYSRHIYDYTINQGVGDHFEYYVRNLEPDTVYMFDVAAKNSYPVRPVRSYSPVEFRTKAAPVGPPSAQHASTGPSLAVILGATFGGLAFLGLVAFLVYIGKYRNMKISYASSKGGPEKSRKYKNSAPLELGVTEEMKKVALT